MEKALRALREAGNQTAAARSVGISPERFRLFLRENKLAQRDGRVWTITDRRHREVVIFSKGRATPIEVAGFEPASLVGRHNAAVRQFLETNDRSRLAPFEGLSVTDVRGRTHPLETRPNVLYRLAAAGSEGFEQVYRLIA